MGPELNKEVSTRQQPIIQEKLREKLKDDKIERIGILFNYGHTSIKKAIEDLGLRKTGCIELSILTTEEQQIFLLLNTLNSDYV